jgi:hypothetical protein
MYKYLEGDSPPTIANRGFTNELEFWPFKKWYTIKIRNVKFSWSNNIVDSNCYYNKLKFEIFIWKNIRNNGFDSINQICANESEVVK